MLNPSRAKTSRPVVQALENRTLLSAASVTSLVESSAMSAFGQAVTLKATVAPKVVSNAAVSGTVTFKDNGIPLQTVPLNAARQAVLTTAALPVGTDKITAFYNGSAAFAASASANLSHSVSTSLTRTTVAVSTPSAVLGTSVTLAAVVGAVAPGGGVPTGTITFFDGSASLGAATLDSQGRASLVVSTLFLGKHTISATYAGSASYRSSISAGVALTIVLPAGDTLNTTRLESTTVHAGAGVAPVVNDGLKVNYTGYLTNGTKFDSSLNPGGSPFEFALGGGEVIPGWDLGLAGMKVGETRVLIIPPSLAYGNVAKNGIPANSTLVFIVNLLQIELPTLVVGGGSPTILLVFNNQTPRTADGTNFGAIKVGTSSVTEVFLLASANAANVQFTVNPPITLSGANAADFTLTPPAGDGNNNLYFTLVFTPKAKGSRIAYVSIHTNDVRFPNFTFEIIGTGV